MRQFRLTFTFITFILLTAHSYALPYSPYSNRELEELEKEFIEQINSSQLVIRIPLANQYINHLARLLAQHGQLKAPTFFIVKSNEINAFAGPGGYIGVNSQLILATANESELAAVMAHEMAHVRQHHLYRMIEHQKQMRIPMLASMLASIALGVLNPSMGTGAMMASMSGFAQDGINFIRSNEKEADSIGIDMLIHSGLNPRGMASFFKKMQQSAQYYYTSDIPAILRSHPIDDFRIAEAENRSEHLSKKVVVDSLDYALFKELIRISVAGSIKLLLDDYQRQCPMARNGVACQYGYALALMEANQYQAAFDKLTSLEQQNPSNINFQIALAIAETNLKQYTHAVTRLRTLHANFPEHYAVFMALAESFIASGQASEAASLLLKGSRQFQQDLPLCEALAEAQSANHQAAYAYFTSARCQLLQGKKQRALQQLKLAKRLTTQNRLLAARIDASIEDLK